MQRIDFTTTSGTNIHVASETHEGNSRKRVAIVTVSKKYQGEFQCFTFSLGDSERRALIKALSGKEAK